MSVWDDVPATARFSCERCGLSDSTLRIAVFPYVFSVIILTFRRSWGGLFCKRCRRKEMTKAKLSSLFFGWWGIPFGILYTMGALLEPSEGRVPRELNGEYLYLLGLHFYEKELFTEARQAWQSSLTLTDSALVRSALQSLPPDEQPAANLAPVGPSNRKSHRSGWLWFWTAFSVVVLVAMLLLGVLAGVMGQKHSSTDGEPRWPTTSKATPDGWERFANTELGFTSHIPRGWIPETSQEDEGKRDSASVITFAPPLAEKGPDATVITVVKIPAPRT